MKTQILQLEPHDDVISTRDKMGWGQATRVVLVWPKRERILVRKLDLLLLHRHALKMGAQLALVTDDPDVRFNARELAIPVFKNLRQAHSSSWRAGRRPSRSIERRQPRPNMEALRQDLRPAQPAWYNLPLVRRLLHAISILAALALLALFIPGAKITLSPQTQLQEIRFTVSAGPSVQTVNVTGDLPARSASVIVEGSDQMSTTGSLPVPENASTGRVEFSNLTGTRVEIPEGTVVTSLPVEDQKPVRFSTTVTTNVAAGASVMVNIRCLQPGQLGNLPAGKIKAVEGPLGLKLSVINPVATMGGSEQLAPAPTPADAQKLFDRLFSDLQASALKELGSEDQNQTTIPIESSLKLVSVLRETYSPPLVDSTFTQPATQLSLALRLEFQALVVTKADLQEVSLRVLDANLPSGFQPVPAPQEYASISKWVTDEDLTTRWRMVARRELQAIIDEQKVLSLARGQSPIQAEASLEKGLLVDQVHIQLTPNWWPRMPWLPFRIQVLTTP